MDGADVTFLFQFGLLRDTVSIKASALTLKTLKEYACNFIITKCPDHGLNPLFERLLLFKHNYNSSNVLQLITNAAEIVDETLIEIVLKAQAPTEKITVRPHTLSVHSYKTPTFCDFCGEMLFGLVKQGIKCEGCGMNFHKRCVVKIPNNCIQDSNRQRRSSTMLNVPRSPSQSSTNSFGGVCDDNQNMGAYNLSQNNTSSVTTSKQSNSSSLGDKNSWTDREAISRIKIPHTFVVHSYTRPTICGYCKKLLRGLFKQGLQCKDCHYNIHKKCIDKIPKDCIGENSKDMCGGAECSDSDAGDHEGKFDDSKEDGDMDSDVESSPNSSQHESCPLLNEHEVGEVLNQQLTISDEPLPNSCQPSSSESPLSNNIPLMRIVQSVKHTKKRGVKILKQGWLTHYTNRNSAMYRKYWRLDSKAIKLYLNDTIRLKYYQEIPLADILSIETFDSSESSKKVYSFKIRTEEVDYYVGEDSLYYQLREPTVEREKDFYSGKSWVISIRNALMPVTSNYVTDEDTPVESENAVLDMSHIYQVFPDEVLGSGQFGIVYGGVHRKTGRAVAIKVIDKLRFPTKQEAQLKNEVAILQNLSHNGVVNLERMFETPERIFVVMEKLKGDMLEMILNSERGRLTERVTKFIITQILVALKHLHSKNIVHCDLKPENVLLSSSNEFTQVKLCDFGFARIIGKKSFRRSVVGTPAYLAPEVLRNKGYNRSLDMWSVGVIIYVSLSGTFPFNEDEDINEQIQNAGFMYPSNPWNEISANAINLINNLLQVKQRKRFTVDKSLQHIWLQDYQTWCDLRELENRIDCRYLTHESDDERWMAYSNNQQT